MSLKPCYLSHILLEEQAENQVIFITEVDGSRRIPITIGPLEALAIDRAVKGHSFPRPLTHDLFVNLVNETNYKCREIRIVDLRDKTFFAELVFIGPQEEEVVLDCRPSDAIALMVRMPGTPLLVNETVLEEAGE
jgi:uncharacterized protein